MVNETTLGHIEWHFGQFKDPRVERTEHHKLLDIIVIRRTSKMWLGHRLFDQSGGSIEN